MEHVVNPIERYLDDIEAKLELREIFMKLSTTLDCEDGENCELLTTLPTCWYWSQD